MKSAFIILSGLAFLFSIVAISIWLKRNDNNSYVDEESPITPRSMNGLDTIRANDSLYVISFTIKNVLPDTIENESQDKYDYDSKDYE